MIKRKNKFVYMLIPVFVFLTLCGFDHEKNEPILKTEEKVVYKNYELSKIQRDGSLNKNANLVGDNVVFIGTVDHADKDNKTIYLNNSGVGSNWVKVELPKAISFQKNSRVVVFGKVKKPEDSVAVIKSDACNMMSSGNLNKDYYEYSVDSKGKIKLYPYSTVKSKVLNGGKIKYGIPEEWDELESKDIFCAELVDKNNATCYKLGENEYLGVFYFKFDTFLMYDSNKNDIDKIENTIIQNICPDEADRINIFDRKVPQETFKTVYENQRESIQDIYVVSDAKLRVEFNFQETSGGLFVITYIYDENKAHNRDVIYMLSTVKLK